MSWGVYLALALGVLNLLVWAGVVVAVNRLVATYKPVVAAMFGPPRK